MKKIVVISMVKNEADVIESFVRHALSFADEVLIADHMSSDRTPEILKKLQEEGLSLTVQKYYRTELAHAEVMNDLMWKAVDEHEADFVLPMDGDEFLVNTDTDEPCRDILQRLDPNALYKLEWRNYEPLYPHEDEDKFLLFRPCRRSRDFTLGQKTIVGAALLRQKPFKLVQGCHYAYWDTETGQINVPWTTAPFLHTAHFHWRSDEQYAAKMATSWINNVAKYSVHTPTAWFLKKGYHQLLRREPIAHENMPDEGEHFDLRPFVPPQTLRYSQNVRPDVLANLLSAAEVLAQSYLEYKVLQRKKIVTIIIPYNGDDDALQSSLQAAYDQTYPYKEILVACMGTARQFPEDLPKNDDVSPVFLCSEAEKDIFAQISEKARGEYVQWLFPDDGVKPDKFMKMVACLEAQDYSFPFALSNGSGTFADWMSYTDLFFDAEFVMLRRPWLLQYLLRTGKYPSGGIAGLLIRRSAMERRQWFRDCFWEDRPLFFSMFLSLLQDFPQEDGNVALIQEMYCTQDLGRISLDDWVWHQIDWACQLVANKALLSAEEYTEALQQIRKNEAFAEPHRGDIGAPLWGQYQAALAEL